MDAFAFFFFLFFNFSLMAQDQFPLEAIPAAPESTTSGNVLARMTQGLGYRYHWATKDLREEDLNYRPTQKRPPPMKPWSIFTAWRKWFAMRHNQLQASAL